MNKFILICISLIFTSSAFSISSNKAVILGHKAEVTGADSQGRAVSGHLNNDPIILNNVVKSIKDKKHNKSTLTKKSKQ